MSKREGPTRIVLKDFLDTKEREGRIEVELPSGDVLRIPPPVLWPEEVGSLKNDPQGIVDGCKLIVGIDQWEMFTSQGGTSVMLMALVDEGLKAQGLELGESSASTGSL